jgi:hypothetical protein
MAQRGWALRHVLFVPGENEMKLITTPFLSGLCYGPVHLGVYDPWTFVGLIHQIYRLPRVQPPPLALLLLLPSTSGMWCESKGFVL